MLLKQTLLVLIGLSCGGVISAGIFAFLAIIGVFPRVIGKTKTKKHILLYETVIIIGGVLGNVIDLFEFPIPFLGPAALSALGLSYGVFVGCLVMSLSETLKVLPVMNRRARLAVGLQYVILVLAVGKLSGALLYFSQGMGT